MKLYSSHFVQNFQYTKDENEWDYEYKGNVLNGLKTLQNNFDVFMSWFGEVRDILFFWNFLR